MFIFNFYVSFVFLESKGAYYVIMHTVFQNKVEYLQEINITKEKRYKNGFFFLLTVKGNVKRYL